MKQVLIAKHKALGNHPFSQVELFASKDQPGLTQGVNTLTLEWPLEKAFGVGYFLVLNHQLAIDGCVLASWQLRGETVDIVLFFANSQYYPIAGAPIVTAYAYEPVQLVARENVTTGVITVTAPAPQPPKPSRRRKPSKP